MMRRLVLFLILMVFSITAFSKTEIESIDSYKDVYDPVDIDSDYFLNVRYSDNWNTGGYQHYTSSNAADNYNYAYSGNIITTFQKARIYTSLTSGIISVYAFWRVNNGSWSPNYAYFTSNISNLSNNTFFLGVRDYTDSWNDGDIYQYKWIVQVDGIDVDEVLSNPITFDTSTDLPTATSTATFTPTRTAIPTPTFTSTATNTRTATPVPPTATGTPQPTNTFTPTFTATHTFTPIPTNTPKPTGTMAPTLTNTPTATNTNTATATPTKTNTPIGTWTPIPTGTFTFTPTRTNTNTPTATQTFTPTQTATNTPLPSSTFTPTFTVTQTFTPVPPTATLTYTPTGTATYTFTPTPTAIDYGQSIYYYRNDIADSSNLSIRDYVAYPPYPYPDVDGFPPNDWSYTLEGLNPIYDFLNWQDSYYISFHLQGVMGNQSLGVIYVLLECRVRDYVTDKLISIDPNNAYEFDYGFQLKFPSPTWDYNYINGTWTIKAYDNGGSEVYSKVLNTNTVQLIPSSNTPTPTQTFTATPTFTPSPTVALSRFGIKTIDGKILYMVRKVN